LPGLAVTFFPFFFSPRLLPPIVFSLRDVSLRRGTRFFRAFSLRPLQGPSSFPPSYCQSFGFVTFSRSFFLSGLVPLLGPNFLMTLPPFCLRMGPLPVFEFPGFHSFLSPMCSLPRSYGSTRLFDRGCFCPGVTGSFLLFFPARDLISLVAWLPFPECVCFFSLLLSREFPPFFNNQFPVSRLASFQPVGLDGFKGQAIFLSLPVTVPDLELPSPAPHFQARPLLFGSSTLHGTLPKVVLDGLFGGSPCSLPSLFCYEVLKTLFTSFTAACLTVPILGVDGVAFLF